MDSLRHSIEMNASQEDDPVYFDPKLQERWVEMNKDTPDFNADIFRRYQYIYQERAKRFEAKRKDNRSLRNLDLDFMVKNYGKPNPSAFDLMHEDATRENEDWNRKYTLVEVTKKESMVEMQEEYGKQMERLQISIDRMNRSKKNSCHDPGFRRRDAGSNWRGTIYRTPFNGLLSPSKK